MAQGKKAQIQVLIDGCNSNSATIIKNYIEGIVAMHNLSLPLAAKGGVSTPVIELRQRFWFNEKMEASYFMVPGVFAMILFVITTILTAMGLTRERETGTYEQLIVSPISPMVIIVGKTLPFAFIGLFSVTITLVAAALIFGVTLQGSYLLFYGTTVIFLMTTLSLGIFISSLAKTMQQALMLSFLVMLPMIILSGLMFPIANMPPFFRALTYINPMRYFLQTLRGLFLKEVPWDYVLVRAAALAAMGSLLMGAAAMRFQKKLQ
jgi:ABC-2 type transport system permease protein